MMKERAGEVLTELTASKGVTERQMLALLLNSLQASHLSMTAINNSKIALNTQTIVTEVDRWRPFAGSERPATMMAALAAMTLSDLYILKLNAQQGNDQAKKTAEVAECLTLVMKRLINAAEEHALRATLAMENDPNGLKMTREHPDGNFANFRKHVTKAKAAGQQGVLIESPQVIGDTHEEIVAALELLAEAGMVLAITPPLERGKPSPEEPPEDSE